MKLINEQKERERQTVLAYYWPEAGEILGDIIKKIGEEAEINIRWDETYFVYSRLETDAEYEHRMKNLEKRLKKQETYLLPENVEKRRVDKEEKLAKERAMLEKPKEKFRYVNVYRMVDGTLYTDGDVHADKTNADIAAGYNRVGLNKFKLEERFDT